MSMKHLLAWLLSTVLAVAAAAAHAGSYEDFFHAVEVDDAGTVTQLLARGFDINSPDEHGQVALYLALRADSPKVVATLLGSPGLHVDAANAKGETPLMMAALKGKLGACQRLLEQGAQVNRDGWSPLHYAASGPQPKVVSLLLERGAQINALSPNGSTPLMMAARYGAQDSAELLVAHGADARLRNAKGLNAADFARAAGREALAARLEAAAR
jgi:ankyrin repeat protein